jgi:hypothetical protein
MAPTPYDTKHDRYEDQELVGGPLILGMLLTNQNNANAANSGNANNSIVCVAQVTLELPATRPAEADKHAILRLRGTARQEIEPTVSRDDLRFWRENGYLVIPKAISSAVSSDLVTCVNSTVERLFDTKEEVVVHSHVRDRGEEFVSPCGRVIASLTQGDTTPTPQTSGEY